MAPPTDTQHLIPLWQLYGGDLVCRNGKRGCLAVQCSAHPFGQQVVEKGQQTDTRFLCYPHKSFGFFCWSLLIVWKTGSTESNWIIQPVVLKWTSLALNLLKVSLVKKGAGRFSLCSCAEISFFLQVFFCRLMTLQWLTTALITFCLMEKPSWKMSPAFILLNRRACLF